MIDIYKIEDGKDLNLQDNQVPKAVNILSVQEGTLEYAPDFGIDLRFFLDGNVTYQTESFKAYIIEKMAKQQVTVVELIETVDNFVSNFDYGIGN